MLPYPLNTKLSRLFLLTGCLKALYILRHTPARGSEFQSQDNFAVTVNMQKVAKTENDIFQTFFIQKGFP